MSEERKKANKGGKKASISEETGREIQAKLQREIDEGISNLLVRLREIQVLQTPQTAHYDGESGVGIINLAGNNSGASMNLASPFTNQALERGFRVNQQHGTVNIFVNSNVQGVNNSILYNSSCTLRDPGVHLDVHPGPSDDSTQEDDVSDLKSSVSATSDIAPELRKSSADVSVATAVLLPDVSEPGGVAPRHPISERVPRQPGRRGFSLGGCFRIVGGARSDASE